MVLFIVSLHQKVDRTHDEETTNDATRQQSDRRLPSCHRALIFRLGDLVG